MQALSPNTVYAFAALAFAAAGAIAGVRSRSIPNFISASGIGAGLLLHLALGGWRSLLSAALAGTLAGGMFLLFYLAGGMGASDVKLMAAVCCLAGLAAVAQILVGAALAGGLAGLLVALFRRCTKATLANVGRLPAHHGSAGPRPHPELNLHHPRALRLPYGLAIAAGAATSVCNVFAR